MLRLDISAESITELQQKAFEALGVSGKQLTLGLPPVGAAQSPAPVTAAPTAKGPKAEKAPPKTKKEVEANRQAKNATAKNAAEVIQNNQEAGDEIDAIEAHQDEVDSAANAEETHTIDDCKAALKKVITTKGMDDAAAILKHFNAARATDLKPEQFANFIKKCEKTVAEAAAEA